jgi:alpha-amylase
MSSGLGEGEKRMQIPDGHAGEVWTDVLGWFEGEVVIGEDGWADFKCPASSVSVWVNKDARGREEFRVGDMELEKGVEELKI